MTGADPLYLTDVKSGGVRMRRDVRKELRASETDLISCSCTQTQTVIKGSVGTSTLSRSAPTAAVTLSFTVYLCVCQSLDVKVVVFMSAADQKQCI